MSKEKDRIVSKRPDGKWQEKSLSSSRAGSIHDTQGKAVEKARERLIKTGGGELITKGVDGKIRSKDTIAPGNDPFPPRDREH